MKMLIAVNNPVLSKYRMKIYDYFLRTSNISIPYTYKNTSLCIKVELDNDITPEILFILQD